MFKQKKWPYFTNKMRREVNKVLKSGKVNRWTGTKVNEFEKKFSEYVGHKYGIAVSNGTISLELCLKALGINSDDEVLVTSRSFIASANVVLAVGAVPIFCDVDYDTHNVDLENIKKRVSSKTKAIILVHLHGLPCEMEEIVEYCQKNNIFLIEDCAQAHGAIYKNKKVGSFGILSSWSFCQDKIITTGGEGGMITTNNYELYKEIWQMKDHGKNLEKITSKKKTFDFFYLHDTLGSNFRMTEMQAVLGLCGLKKLEKWINHRNDIAKIYNINFSKSDLFYVYYPKLYIRHAYYKYPITIYFDKLRIDKSKVLEILNDNKIKCFYGMCGEIYKEKVFNISDYTAINSKKLSENSILFLCDPTIGKKQAKLNCLKTIKILESYRK